MKIYCTTKVDAPICGHQRVNQFGTVAMMVAHHRPIIGTALEIFSTCSLTFMVKRALDGSVS